MKHKPSCSWHDSPETPCNCGADSRPAPAKTSIDWTHYMDEKPLVAYYAHPMAIYDTPQEQRDLVTLRGLGFQVLNPNAPFHQNAGKGEMAYYLALVERCDVLAFRSLPDGSIPAGVAREIKAARKSGKLVIELPSAVLRRCLSIKQTAEALRESGQR